jgi:catechol 2,3-dioxygenase-like lactoylglutathione lyase family enzyme
VEVRKLDFVGVPARDAKRLRQFYVGTLGLRPDDHSEAEFWVGDTCFAVWEPEQFGLEFEPQRNAAFALHVDDVEAARKELEAKGVEFIGETLETPVCYMALFRDPDGNDVMLHQRYAPYEDGSRP